MRAKACHFFYAVLLVLVTDLVLLAEPVEVVTPSSALPTVVTTDNKYDKDAAEDLCNYLSRVYGRTIVVSSAPQAAGFVIHVGRDTFVNDNTPEIDELFADGYVVKCIEVDRQNHIILAGKADWSAQWAVEQFLKDYCGVHWLFPDPVYGEVVPSRPTITIDSDCAQRYEPDYMNRANCSMYYYNPARTLLRLRPKGYGAYGSHALQNIFKKEEFDAHPEWFAYFMDDGKTKSYRGWENDRPQARRQWWSYGNGWQICTTNRETIDHTVKYVLDYFEMNPHLPVVSVGANDGHGWCECPECKEFANSFTPAYTTSELYWHWVNQIAREVAQTYPDKSVEALAYGAPITPPRFNLEENVAITLTIIYDQQFETIKGWKPLCKSINLYTYMYGRSFLGFRHYPHAVRDFLKWGHEELGALAHVTEGGGDWTIDGPKYHYLQALQWDVNADPAKIMADFCADSYGKAAEPMGAFWDRLEQCYENRPLVPYGKDRETQRLCFYTWVSWQNPSYLRPNTEFEGYTIEDIDFLDKRIAQAVLLAADDTPEVQFRVERMLDAWKYVQTMLLSKVKYCDNPPNTTVTSDTQEQLALSLAQDIAKLRADRRYYRGRMRMYPHINPRMMKNHYWSLASATTLFSRERALLDQLCTAITVHIHSKNGPKSAQHFWQRIDSSDHLWHSAQTQLYMLSRKELVNAVVNGDFESGNVNGWAVSGSSSLTSGDNVYYGQYCLRAANGATITQDVSVEPRQRYRLSLWVKNIEAHKSDAPAVETGITFYEGSGDWGALWAEPTRNLLSFDALADGWVPLRTTVDVPAGANGARITIKTHSKPVLLDKVGFELIEAAEAVDPGTLADSFSGQSLDCDQWFQAASSGGTQPPKTDSGWLIYDDESMYPLVSYAAFNDLLKYEAKNRYRLRFHVAPLSDVLQEEVVFAFGIQAGTGRMSSNTTGMFYYHYFPSAKRARPALSCYNWQGTTRTYSGTWNLEGLKSASTDVWYTFYFDPHEVTVYASDEGYNESDVSLVCSYPHGITELKGPRDHSVYLKIDDGSYRLDEISLTSPRNMPVETDTEDNIQRIQDVLQHETPEERKEDMDVIEVPMDIQ